MLAGLLPPQVISAEAYTDPPGVFLYPEEEAVITRAVDKRRREFTTGRHCARQALSALGVSPGPLPRGERGAPVWPAGVVGSLTHCDGYRAAAVAHRSEVTSLGVDAEPHARLPDDVLDGVTLPTERVALAGLERRHPRLHWDRLLFSAKESVYKTWFPLTGAWLGFEEAEVEFLAPRADPWPAGDVPSAADVGEPGAPDGPACSGEFRARLLRSGRDRDGHPLRSFEGRWLVARGLLLTAVTYRTPGAGSANGSVA
ncbi:4'-phosphopantetheinyl transferase family protein [Streptomyces uncialis]|uniref:4'-phosphopantetheinyl transferase family protein n=1 Tax=Streptomyces uncialis TaxID=1048205 RepID=UPI003F4D3539